MRRRYGPGPAMKPVGPLADQHLYGASRLNNAAPDRVSRPRRRRLCAGVRLTACAWQGRARGGRTPPRDGESRSVRVPREGAGWSWQSRPDVRGALPQPRRRLAGASYGRPPGLEDHQGSRPAGGSPRASPACVYPVAFEEPVEVLRAIDPLGSYFSYFVGLDESMETR